MTKKQKRLLIRIIVSAVLFISVLITERLLQPHRLTALALYLIPYLTAGSDVLIGCIKNLFRGRLFDEQLLMTIATVGAIIIGEYPESVFVMVFYQTGELFQSIAVGKSRRSITSLMELAPEEATVLRDGEEKTVFPEEVAVGEHIFVRPGEKIPLDSTVIKGEAAVDMRALTGESAPVDIYEGCQVKAGSICLTGSLELKADREYSDSTAAKILELVENSSLNKARTEKFLTRFSRVYTPAVVLCALVVAIVPSVITGQWSEWVYRALIFLVVSCPCALVISVPLSYFGGIGAASSKGILIKGANYLEALGNAKYFAFDKTGTLTTGEFTVSRLLPENGFSEKELISLASTAECYSNHPLAQAIVKYADNIIKPDSITEYPGLGIKASRDGKTILAGNRRFLENNKISIPEDITGTAVYVALEGVYCGAVRLCDSPKENVREALSQLEKLGVSKIFMLTGDNALSAKETAKATGISHLKADLLPRDKAEFVKKLCEEKKSNETVVFAGDGINDAPVLSLTDVGIAMGGAGSDAAIEAADVVIMDDNIEKCAVAVKIAKKTKGIVRQNVTLALGIKFLVLILAGIGIADMWIGVLADVGVAILAILNAMRTLKQ